MGEGEEGAGKEEEIDVIPLCTVFGKTVGLERVSHAFRSTLRRYDDK